MESQTETKAAAMEIDNVHDEETQPPPPVMTVSDNEIKSDPDGYESDSESKADEDEEAEEALAENLGRTLAENPLDYESHTQYIHCLRKLGHIEKLRQARESMNRHFPLTPQMWREWAKDEASIMEGSGAFTEVEKLYERGVKEYLSVPLWCDYIEFLQEHDPTVAQCTPGGISKMRGIFERALTAAGLHVTEGNKIWNSYREFEQAIFLTLDDNDNEEKTKQVQRIRSLFHRQLSVPLADLKSTLSSYKHWETDQGNICDNNSSEADIVPATVLSAYQKALEMYNARSLYEEQLCNVSASDADKLQHYMNYINFEESSGDPARVQILYERAVSDFPISSDLWLAYTSYLDRNLKVADVLRSAYARASRNCPWVGDLWVRYLLSLERIHASDEELNSVFESSLACTFPSIQEYLELFLTRIDGLRRRFSFGNLKEDQLDYSHIRTTFQRAVEYLSNSIGTDNLLGLYAYWARLEVRLCKDLPAARRVWENLIKRSGSMREFWEGYIQMEVEMGHISEARSIYKRCYNRRFLGTGSEDLCQAWLQFERQYGTLDDFDHAVKKVSPRLQELVIFKMQHEAPSSDQKDGSVAKNAPQKRRLKTSTEKQLPPKRQKINTASAKRFDATVTGQEEVPTSPKAKDDDNKQVSGESKGKESKARLYTDQCTAFVSNLSLQANEKHLHDFFTESGGVREIRILKDKYSGRSRGLAYVDFVDEDHLSAAIAKNKMKLLGRELSIARSDPKKSQKKSSAVAAKKGSGRGGDEDFYGKENVAEAAGGSGHNDISKLTGKNTFAAPRALRRPVGFIKKDSKAGDSRADASTEQPKSNEEFREMLLRK